MLAVILLVVVAGAISILVYQQGMVLGKDFYAIGVSPQAPEITDQRFNTIKINRVEGWALLQQKAIDLYLDGNNVYSRRDSRSQYAVGALKQYLEKKELSRIANEYDIETAFPLRVEIDYLKVPSDNVSAGANVSLADILGSAQLSSGTEASTPDMAGSLHQLPAPSTTDEDVKKQLESFTAGNRLPEFKAEFASNKDVVIPSLMTPPIPLAQVMLAFAYVLPIFFITIFFTSSFIEEKMNRRLNILLSAPVTPLEIIVGKMLPYMGYSVIVIVLVTLFLRSNIFLALAIFIPIVLFIFAIYLGVAMLYRTFKDQTFFSMLAVSMITAFLVFPAMFTGINNLSYISPLTLSVQMYRGESFGLKEYLFSTGPMYLIFLLAMIMGTRVFNEEYLMGFRPLYRKVSEAIYLTINKRHVYISIFVLGLLLIPVVFMVQLASIVIASNLPMPLALWVLFGIAVIVEEVAKSAGVAVLIENGLVKSLKNVALLSLISAVAFFLGEKLLLYLSLSVISESIFTKAIFSSHLLWVPLVLHVVTTSIVCLITARFGVKRYLPAVLAGSAVHIVYNLFVIGVIP